jgi:predicted sugar kinase
LPLGLVRFERAGGSDLAYLGVSLRHVMVELTARRAATPDITGGRAPIALAFAERFNAFHGIPLSAEVQVEWAIATRLGLGSDGALALAVARALAELHDLPHDSASLARALSLGPQSALEVNAYAPSGIFLCRVPDSGDDVAASPLSHYVLPHRHANAWAFAMFHPLAPEGTPPSLEADRILELLGAAPYLSAETGRIATTELWPALEGDDIARFGRALREIQSLNHQALTLAGQPVSFTPVEQSIQDTFQNQGAHAWGRSPTGLAMYGLVQGETAAAEMKKKLLALMGHYNGTTMSTAIDTEGARVEPYDPGPEVRSR